MSIIKVRYKKTGKERYISEKDFDDLEMELAEQDSDEEKSKTAANIKDIINSGTAPGVVSSSSNTPSMYHNNKLDEGAVENLLDVGLDGAKNRAVQRNNKYGSSFRKVRRRRPRPRRKK